MTASQLTVPPAVCTVLLLAESEAERERWLQVLGELQRLLLDTRPRPRPVYTLKEAYDNGLPLLPHALCAAIIGEPPAEEHCPGPAPGRSLGLSGGSLPSPYSHELRTLRIAYVTLSEHGCVGSLAGAGLGFCHCSSLCLRFCFFSKNLKGVKRARAFSKRRVRSPVLAFLPQQGDHGGVPHCLLWEPGAQRDLREEARERCLLASLGRWPRP